MYLLKLEHCSKVFIQGGTPKEVVFADNMEFEEGMHIIYGKRGAGKTTLLHMMAGIEAPTDGEVLYQGRSLYKAKSPMTVLHPDFAIIEQADNLIQEFTLEDNIRLPLHFSKKQNTPPFDAVVDAMRIRPRLKIQPGSLTREEQQQAVVARALISGAKVIFADDITAQLAEEEGKALVRMLIELCKQYRVTLFLTTCDQDLLQYGDKQYRLQGGELAPLQ